MTTINADNNKKQLVIKIKRYLSSPHFREHLKEYQIESITTMPISELRRHLNEIRSLVNGKIESDIDLVLQNAYGTSHLLDLVAADLRADLRAMTNQ